MLMSWAPTSSLVAGVKIGSGRRSDSLRPGGSAMPQISPPAWYEFQPEPEMYPRATHSIGSGAAFFTSMLRPRSWSA